MAFWGQSQNYWGAAGGKAWGSGGGKWSPRTSPYGKGSKGANAWSSPSAWDQSSWGSDAWAGGAWDEAPTEQTRRARVLVKELFTKASVRGYPENDSCLYVGKGQTDADFLGRKHLQSFLSIENSAFVNNPAVGLSEVASSVGVGLRAVKSLGLADDMHGFFLGEKVGGPDMQDLFCGVHGEAYEASLDALVFNSGVPFDSVATWDALDTVLSFSKENTSKLMMSFSGMASLGAKMVVAGLAGAELTTCIAALQNFSEKVPPQPGCDAEQAGFVKDPTGDDVFASFLHKALEERFKAERERISKGAKKGKGKGNVTIEADLGDYPFGDAAAARPAARGQGKAAPGGSLPQPTTPAAFAKPLRGKAPRAADEAPDEILTALQAWNRPAFDMAGELLRSFSAALSDGTATVQDFKALVLAYPEEVLAAFRVKASHEKIAARTTLPGHDTLTAFATKLTEIIATAADVIPPSPVLEVPATVALDLDDEEEPKESGDAGADREPKRTGAASAEAAGEQEAAAEQARLAAGLASGAPGVPGSSGQ